MFENVYLLLFIVQYDFTYRAGSITSFTMFSHHIIKVFELRMGLAANYEFCPICQCRGMMSDSRLGSFWILEISLLKVSHILTASTCRHFRVEELFPDNYVIDSPIQVGFDGPLLDGT